MRGACPEGKLGGWHGHAMGAPYLGLGGMARQRHTVGKEAWAPRHAGCLRSDTNSAQARARRCTGTRKAAHRRAQGSVRQCTGSARQCNSSTQALAGGARQRIGSARASHRQHQGQCSNSVQAVSRQGMLATRTLADEGTWLRCSWGALKDPQGREWEWHHAPNTE